MAKELFVSSSPHETKVAVFEDDQLVEVYFERESSVGLVGGIYKGRVNRVLPGMQSAFVNIGLDRDAFLYVSDFVEDEEEYDKIFTDAEARATRFVETGSAAPAAPPAAAPAAPAPVPVAASAPAEPKPVAAPVVAAPAELAAVEAPAPAPPQAPPPSSRSPEQGDSRRHEGRGRGRFRRGARRDFRPSPRQESPSQDPAPPSGDRGLTLLPGESLAKYRDGGAPSGEWVEPHQESIASPVIASEETGAAANATSTADQHGSVESAPEAAAIREIWEEHAPEAPAEPKSEVVDSESTVIFTPLTVFGRSISEPPHHVPDQAESSATAEPSSSALGGTSTELAPLAATEGEAPTGLAASASEEAAGPEDIEGEEAADGGDEAEEAAEGETAAASTSGEVSETGAPAGETGSESGEKKYTLREQEGRPRFAPRRRRGRRGGSGGGGGAPRRGDRPESARSGNQSPVQISDILKEGQEIIVQIAKEPLGTKGARITSHVALPGRYLVYMPTISHIGVSRKIGSEEERLRLRNIILENRGTLTGGFIVRTAGAGRSEEEFKTDLRFLSTLWGEIRSKAESMKAPATLHRDLNLVQRILRDLLSPDFKQVRVDNESDYERCVEFVNQSQPSLAGHIKLYTRKTPIFEEFGIQQEIDQALKPKVWLKSGGYIVINQTEALVAIDVNTGKFVGKTNRLEDTIVKTNIDAINEIVRQVRLRDLGGIIVIDFIDMDERKNRTKVVQALEEALRRDRAPTKVVAFSDFGLVAITRKRVKQSLERSLCQPCSYCTGAGWVKSVTTICYEILGEVKKMAPELESDTITLRVHPDVAQALKSKQGALLSEIEALTRKDVFLKGDAAVHLERFEIY